MADASALPPEIRHDWTVAEVEALFALPFNDLVFRAQTVHRAHFPAAERGHQPRPHFFIAQEPHLGRLGHGVGGLHGPHKPAGLDHSQRFARRRFSHRL